MLRRLRLLQRNCLPHTQASLALHPQILHAAVQPVLLSLASRYSLLSARLCIASIPNQLIFRVRQCSTLHWLDNGMPDGGAMHSIRFVTFEQLVDGV